MKGKIKTTLLIAVLLISTIAIVNAHPAVTITVATGGDAISADDTGVAWTTLGPIVITEGAIGDIGAGTFTLTLPTGFEFDTVGTAPDVATTGGTTLSADAVATMTATTLQVTTIVASTVTTDGVLTIGGTDPIKVRPDTGTLASGDIVMTAGTIAGVTIGTTPFGTLTMVPGALADFTIAGGLDPCIAHTDWAANDVTVTAEDQYGNKKTDYLGTIVWSSSDPVADLPATYPFIIGDAGDHIFPGTDFTMKMVGIAQEIDVADGPISASAPLTFDVDARTITVTLDEEFYKTGDSPVVTVIDDDENDRPSVVETIEVEATSPYPDLILVTLTETGVATGEFMGSFTLVGTDPGENDLWVEDGYTITVDYSAVIDTAVIDDTPPTVAILEPDNEELISDNHPLIRADVDFVGSDIESVVMKLDDVIVSSMSVAGIISYTVPEFPEEMRLSEGLHTVTVTAKDNVGNSYTETWTFTVDLVEPTVSVVVDPDPAMAVPVTFTLTFNEDMDTGTSPVVQFGMVDPYTTHTAGGSWTVDSLREWEGTFSVTTLTGDGVNTISVSVAEDEAGNVMEIDTSNTFVIDTVAPTLPVDLPAVVTDVSVTISWTESTDVDGTGVKEYRIERELVEVATVSHPTVTYVDYSLTAEGSYTYTVTAIDFAGNEAVSAGVIVEFVPGDVIAREIALFEEWNLISLPMIPEDSSIEVVLADIMENVEVVWSYDEGTWSRYLPGLPAFSTLTDMEDGKGYWVMMAGEDSLIAYGTELPEPPTLPPVYHVNEEWNLIGFKSINAMGNDEYFTTITRETLNTAVCYGYDASAQAYELVYLGGELDPVIQFEPGQGYWLYLTEEANIAPPTD